MTTRATPIRLALLSLALLTIGCPATAQPGATEAWRSLADPIFHAIAQDNDLPNGAMPQALGQDADGFLWVGTQNGLARWDGTQFRIYRADPDQPGSLPDNIVTTLHTDAAGRLWVGTEGAGLARYDPAQDQFVSVTLGDAAAGGSVTAIADDGAGGVWAGTGSGLFRVDGGGRLVAHRRHDATMPGSLPDDGVQALLRDRSGALWVGGPMGLVRWDGTRFEPVALAGRARPPDVTCLAQDGSGRVWAGTRKHGAYVISPGAEPKTIPATAGADADDVDPVYSIAEIRPGEIWLGTQAGGILDVDASSLAATRIRHEAALPTTLLNGAVLSILRDRTGLVWVATIHGVTRFDPAQRGIVTVFGDHGRPGGLAASDVLSLLAAPGGRLWAGSRHSGVDIIDPSGGQVSALRPGPGAPETALPPVNIGRLVALPDGTVLLGTPAGLYRADAAGRRVARIAVPGRPAPLPVFALQRIGGEVWLGGPDGLWVLHPDADGTLRVARRVGSDVLRQARPRVLAPGPDGAVWLGTNNGLFLVPAASDRVERIAARQNDPASLSSNQITALLHDEAGRLWVGTLDRGLNLLIGRDQAGRPAFRRFGLAQGVPNDSIDALLPAEDGTIWASTDGGLMTIDPRSLSMRPYGQADGVAIAGYFTAAAARMAATGDLVFGGMGGLTIVHPRSLAAARPPAEVRITETRIGGRSVVARGGDAKPLRILPGADSLSVQFASLAYGTPDLLRYAYRLDGLDTGWTEVDAAHRRAAYTNLPPGRYVLRLRAANTMGVWSQESVLRLLVLPAWYQTIWFRIAELAAAGLAMFALVYGRTAWMRRRARALERLVAERTGELLQAQGRLREAAYGDLLTGLANRRAFNDDFQAMSTACLHRQGSFALLLIDLDGFKQVNDTLGHDTGDAVLVSAARRLREGLRETDKVARLGGDEFAVLLGEAPPREQIDLVCERIIAALSAPIQVMGAVAQIGASIGVAVFPDNGDTQELLYKSADLALYEAKSGGRGVARWSGLASEGRLGALPLNPVY